MEPSTSQREASMKTSSIVILYIFTACVFFVVDMIWLGFAARGIYKKYLGAFLRPDINWAAAIIFYLLFVAGILIFAVFPALEKSSPGRAVVLGALFGFFAYAAYDLTNLATLKGWPLPIVFIDMAWGAFLCGIVSVSGFFMGNFLK
jgi:uncharacterized membrane protein